MVDFNTLNNIDEIKKQTFGSLTDSDKDTIFGHSEIGNDIGKARKVAIFLLSVTEALGKTSEDSTLLSTLKSKDKNSLEYKAVNSHNTLVESAISNLENPSDKREGKSKSEWQTEKSKQDAIVIQKNKEITQLKKELDDYKKSTGQKGTEHRRAKKHRENVEKLLNLVKTDTIANGILDDMVARNAAFANTNTTSDRYTKTGLSEKGRSYMNPG